MSLSTPFWEFQIYCFGGDDGSNPLQSTFYSLLGVSLSKVRAVAVDEVTVTLSTPFWEFRGLVGG